MAVLTGELKPGESLRLRRDGEVVGYFSGGSSTGVTHGEALADFAEMHGLDWRDYDLQSRALVLLSDRAHEVFGDLEIDVVPWEEAPFQGLAKYPNVTDTKTVSRWIAAADARADGRDPPDHQLAETLREVEPSENFELAPDQAVEILAADGKLVGYFGGGDAKTLSLALDQYAEAVLPERSWTATWRDPFEARTRDARDHLAELTLNLVRDPPFRGFAEAPQKLVFPETIELSAEADAPDTEPENDTAAQAFAAFAAFSGPDDMEPPDPDPEPAPAVQSTGPDPSILAAFAAFGTSTASANVDHLDDPLDALDALEHDLEAAAPQPPPAAPEAPAAAVAAPPVSGSVDNFGLPHSRPAGPVSTARPAPVDPEPVKHVAQQQPMAAPTSGGNTGSNEPTSIAFAAAAAAGHFARSLFNAGTGLINGLGHGLARSGRVSPKGTIANQQLAEAELATDMALRSAKRLAEMEPVAAFRDALDREAHKNALPKSRIMAEMHTNPEYLHIGEQWKKAIGSPDVAAAHEDVLQRIAVHQAKWDAVTDSVRATDGDHDRLWSAAEGANRALEEPLKGIPGRDGRSLGDALREWFEELSMKIRQFFALGPASESRPAP